MKVVLILIFSISLSWAEFYKLNIKKVDDNLYKSKEGFYIKTRFCFKINSLWFQEVILNYTNEYSYNNKMIFSDNSTCGVEKIFTYK